MKKFFILFFLLSCTTLTVTYAQTRYVFHTNTNGTDRLIAAMDQTPQTEGGHIVYEYHTAVNQDASSPAIATVSVGVYLNGWNDSDSRDYYDEKTTGTDLASVAFAFDPALYSSITYSWYVLYTDNTYETITYEDYY